MLPCSQPSLQEEGRSLVRGPCPEPRGASLTDTWGSRHGLPSGGKLPHCRHEPSLLEGR